jgi:hypothetical protein
VTGMTRTNATRDAWHPLTKQDRDAVLLELQEVLASSHFSNSKRYPALLRYIVEKTLAGESDLLKERTLGVEVFDRPPSYDTNADTVVRYTAGEVRKRLSLYYHELDRKPSIQLTLPAGSYVPEFVHSHDDLGDHSDGLSLAYRAPLDLGQETPEPETAPPWESGLSRLHGSSDRSGIRDPQTGATQIAVRAGWRLLLGTILALAVLAGLGWRYHAAHTRTALDDFWATALRDQRMVPICTGGSVFAQDRVSGVATAGKDIDYPFLSLQSAAAIAEISALMERYGTTTELQPAASTSLSELREHPVILLGGYNNQWTLRLLQPLRFHFAPEAQASILDSTQPHVRWERDHSLPYSSADDYALIARFRDSTTDSWVIVLAGVGRNGSEAAAQFVSSPHYMQLLRDKIGSDFSNRNIEAVLKVSVIDGKTGAPSLMAAYAW